MPMVDAQRLLVARLSGAMLRAIALRDVMVPF